MSKIPVLIPACNEEIFIRGTLQCLPRSTEPIVIANGCTDATVRIAQECGATVLEISGKGKMPALQRGLRYLGDRALQPILLLDADSALLSAQWPNVMVHALTSGEPQPTMVGGLVYFARRIDPVSGFVYSFKPVLDAHRKNKPHIRGANLGLFIHNHDMLDRLLGLPNYWPGVEPAIVDTFENHGGNVVQSFDPRTIVKTDGSRLTSLATRIKRGPDYTHNHFVDSYNRDAPPGSIKYPSIS